jgi:hypothetical protein
MTFLETTAPSAYLVSWLCFATAFASVAVGIAASARLFFATSRTADVDVQRELSPLVLATVSDEWSGDELPGRDAG